MIPHKIRWMFDAAVDLLVKPKYVPAEFWKKKHQNEGFAAVGIRRLTESENAHWYSRMKKDFNSFLEKNGIDLTSMSILEIGPGTGYWTAVCQELGVSKYVGIDIAESAVKKLKGSFREYDFIAGDFSSMAYRDPTNAVIMIHVDEHVHGDNYIKTMQTVKDVIGNGGLFIVSAYHEGKKSWVPHVEYHGINDLRKVFSEDEYSVSEHRFADDILVGIAHKSSSHNSDIT